MFVIMREPLCLERIKNYFEDLGYRITCILFLRHPATGLDPAYSQMVSAFQRFDSFREFADRRSLQFTRLPLWGSFNRFPEIEVRVLPYTREVKCEGVAKRFLQELGITDFGAAASEQRLNVGAGPREVHFKKWVRFNCAEAGDTISQLQRAKLIELTKGLDFKDTERYRGLTPSVLENFLQKTEQAIKQGRDARWIGAWEQLKEDNVEQLLPANDPDLFSDPHLKKIHDPELEDRLLQAWTMASQVKEPDGQKKLRANTIIEAMREMGSQI
ncbi:hypothetical protein [Ruegeria sp. HKCCD7318]|uniref:hypothetical protein n=1 Tax=Ruegeria sp. HKCCD7318 TaxID=2683014 RepID=UPI001492D7B5|nr:hypothetical protein [Ruegeria sp. HKCCD7318]NOE33377.1 hypothetical protein [Ruegeria sp. HKCCD7318]